MHPTPTCVERETPYPLFCRNVYLGTILEGTGPTRHSRSCISATTPNDTIRRTRYLSYLEPKPLSFLSNESSQLLADRCRWFVLTSDISCHFSRQLLPRNLICLVPRDLTQYHKHGRKAFAFYCLDGHWIWTPAGFHHLHSASSEATRVIKGGDSSS